MCGLASRDYNLGMEHNAQSDVFLPSNQKSRNTFHSVEFLILRACV